MQKYETVNKLSAIEFRRLTGVQKETFVEMVLIIKEAECKRMSAEGAGEYAVDEKARFYRMAKRSATECAGILDVCQRLQLVEEKRYTKGRELLDLLIIQNRQALVYTRVGITDSHSFYAGADGSKITLG